MNSFSRYNSYEIIHKALRARLSQTLTAIGQVDVDDEESVLAMAGQLQTTLLMMESHLNSENNFVHKAMEERAPGSSQTIAGEHVEHVEHIHILGEACEAVVKASPLNRQVLADRLYVLFDRFVQDNLVHMRYEEDHHNAVLWAAYTDEEIQQIERALVAAIAPEKMMLFVSSMIPAIPTRDRALLLGGIRKSAPPEVFARIYGTVMPLLDDRAQAKLARALGEPHELAA